MIILSFYSREKSREIPQITSVKLSIFNGFSNMNFKSDQSEATKYAAFGIETDLETEHFPQSSWIWWKTFSKILLDSRNALINWKLIFAQDNLAIGTFWF